MIQPIQVTETIFRGPRPETIEDFAELRKLGITDMLDLQGDAWEVLTHAANDREFMSWRAGIRVTSIAMNGFLPPNRADVKLALQVLSRPTRIYVHCRWGKDRTGYQIAVERMVIEGWPYKRAVAEMYVNGFHPIYFYWLPSLRKYEGKVKL